MIHYALNREAQWAGPYTDLWIIGRSPNSNPGADYTAAGLTQTFNLLQLTDAGSALLYTVEYPLVKVGVRIAGQDAASNAKVDIGITGVGTQFITGAAGDLEVIKYLLPSGTVGPLAASGNSIYLTATVTVATGTVAALAAQAPPPEVWIFAACPSIRDEFTQRNG